MIQPPRVVDLGRRPYEDAYRVQVEHVEAVQAARAAGTPEAGRILFVEHDPVITIGRHLGAERHLLASPELLASRGVALVESDRGGDITYHGPGQLVAYPILDLNLLNLGLHDYMRLLEASVIDACALFGVRGERDPSATGVWVRGTGLPPGDLPSPSPGRSLPQSAKLCAFGVRVRRWVSMHGLALNVTTCLDHFSLIVPCGLAGRPVTSLVRLLGDRCPPMDVVKQSLAGTLMRRIVDAAAIAETRRASAAQPA